MLVDDEDDIRMVGEISLSSVGRWETVLASSGREAIQLARSEKPDIILLDVMMPILDGPATLKAIRSDETTANIPIIFVTAKVQREEVERYRALGAVGVIAKPFDPMTLPDEVRALVKGL